jgi:hypothetical protein
MIDGGIVTKWDALAIKVLLTDNKSVSKAGYSAMGGFSRRMVGARRVLLATRSLYAGG